ncbi:MAG: tRNA pseudouridine38-40 synthase [Candidatus Omnitrophota bacterium]|jgi:tRNA pseudouridine38-40 synthase
MRIAVRLAYRGTGFSGWQVQKKGERTVQTVFQNSLEKLLGYRPDTKVASRTDAGVHADGQCVHFELKQDWAIDEFLNALNAHMPADLVVREAKLVDEKFHARFSTKGKMYRYQVWVSSTKPIFNEDQVLWLKNKPNLDLMRQAALSLMGEHDFSAFSDRAELRPDRRRTITRLDIIESETGLIEFFIAGNGFLYHMVRIIVSTLLEVGFERRNLESMQLLLDGSEKKAGPAAKAHGLTLQEVYY